MSRIVHALAAASLVFFGTQAQAQPQQDFSKVEVKTIDLGHGIYMLAGAGGNVTVAVAPEGVIMIDDQFAPMSAKLKAAIASVSHAPVRYLINTHFHGDHTGGNANFAKEGAVIVAQENLRKRLAGGAVNAEGRPAPAQPAAALPVVTFADSMKLQLGDKTAEVTHMAPAHTDGDSYVYFRAENVLATGDLFSSTRFPNIDVRNGGGIDGMIASANKLLTVVNDSTQVVPGHGPLAKKGDIAAFRDMLQTSRDRVAKLIADGKTEDQSVQAKPLADLEVKRSSDDENTERFTRLVYQSLKAHS